MLRSLFELAIERKRIEDSSEYERSTAGGVGGYIAFHAALRRAYDQFIRNLTKKCKELVRHHLDSVTSRYSQVYGPENNMRNGFFGFGASTTGYRFNRSSASMFMDLSEGLGSLQEEGLDEEHENVPPSGHLQATPGRGSDSRDPLRESQMTVPETPSPDQPSSESGAKKKEYGIASGRIVSAVGAELGGRKRQMPSVSNARVGQNKEPKHSNSNVLFGNNSSTSAYTEVCSLAAQHFGSIREALIEQSVPSTLNAGFLTPCRDKLVVALGLELFAVTDATFMDMFVAPGAVDLLRNERHVMQKRQKTLQSCLNEFRNLARSL